jgi:hypothetical protein
MSETVDAGGRYQVSDMVSERRRRAIDEIGALGKTDGPPGAPMHRDGMFRLGAMDRMCGLLGVEMAITVARNYARPPASDRYQGYVDVRRLLQLNLRTCVPRVPPSPGAVNKTKCRSAMAASSMSPTVVVSGQDTNLQAAQLHKITRFDLPEPWPAIGDWL